MKGSAWSVDAEEYHRNPRHQTKIIPDGPTKKAKRSKLSTFEQEDIVEDPIDDLEDGQQDADLVAERNPLEEDDPLMGHPEAEDILGVSESTQDCTSDVVEFNSEGKFYSTYEGKCSI